MSKIFFLTLSLLIVRPSLAADRFLPNARVFSSDFGNSSLRVIPKGKGANVELFHYQRTGSGFEEKVTWRGTLPTVPVSVFVTSNAFVTVDDWYDGEENVLGIYLIDDSNWGTVEGRMERKGILKYSRTYSLTELFSESEIKLLADRMSGWSYHTKISRALNANGDALEKLEILLPPPLKKRMLINYLTGELKSE